jgi:hypothetical protein
MNIIDMIKCLFRPITKAYPVAPRYEQDRKENEQAKHEAHRRLTEAEVRLAHLKLLARIAARKEEPH